MLQYPAVGTHSTRRFMTTEDARFTLEDVPAGRVLVGKYWYTGNSEGSDLRVANVPSGGEVKVVVNSPTPSRDVRFRIDIGDASESQYKTGTGMDATRRVDKMTTREPAFCLEVNGLISGNRLQPECVDWRTPDEDGLIVLWDVRSERCHLRVFDWQGGDWFYDGLLYEAEVDIRVDSEPLLIPLGAGSITGQVKVSKEIRRMPQVIAVEAHGMTHPRRARCDDEDNFCVRYLPPGEYVLYGHEDANGFCQLPAVRVANDITDVGTHCLGAGATISGQFRTLRALTPPTAVQAIDANGVALEAIDFRGGSGEVYAIPNLWSSTWTVRLLREKKVLVEKRVTVAGKEAVVVDLTAE